MFLRLYYAIRLSVTFSWDLMLSNFQVFLMSISPEPLWNPGFVDVKFSPELTDFQVTILAHLITATPGTLTVNVEKEDCSMSVHVLYQTQNIKDDMNNISKKLETQIRHVF